MSRAILIVGATGKQGKATIQHLLADPSFDTSRDIIYAVTRDPTSKGSQLLEAQSSAIKLVQGDFNSAAEIFSSLAIKVWGIFILTVPSSKEVEHGIAFIDQAVKAGVQHIVLSSVERGSSNDGFNKTNVPHFASKHEIEAHLMMVAKNSHDFSYTIIRPVYFMDNIEWGFIGKCLSTAWRDRLIRPLQLVDTDDIGNMASKAFLQHTDPRYKNQAISIAGDELTFEQANKIHKTKTGAEIPTTFSFLSSILVWMVPGMSDMFDYLNTSDSGVNVGELRSWTNVHHFETFLEHRVAKSKT